MTRRNQSVRWAAVLVLMGVMSGCAAPAPEPGRPAPAVPDEVTFYDDVPAVQRTEPFRGGCRQITAPVLERLRADFTVDQGSGCAILVERQAPFDVLRVDYAMPADRPLPNYFQHVWNSGEGPGGSSEYFRRLVLDERYYAVEMDATANNPRCDLIVDVGTARALSFSGMVFNDHVEAVQRNYGKLDPYDMDWDNRAGLTRWMQDACPTVERDAVAVLAAIDPGGGTLAIP